MSPASSSYLEGHSNVPLPLSPSTPDDDGTNPVESLYQLNLTDTMRSARSQGSNASSHRSSASSAVSWDSNRSGDSAAAIPSFRSYALRYVSRPDVVTSNVGSVGGTFRRKEGNQRETAEELTDEGNSSSNGWFRRQQPQSRRLVAEMAITEEQAADVAALDEMIGGRRVRKSFLQGKKSTGSSKKKTPSFVQQLMALRGSRTLPRGILGDTVAPPSGGNNTTGYDDGNDLMEALQLFKGTSLEVALLPPCDYADNTLPTPGVDQAAEWFNNANMLQSFDQRYDAGGGKQSPTPSLSDVEMPSKPPSRESSFRGDEEQNASESATAPPTGSDVTASIPSAAHNPDYINSNWSIPTCNATESRLKGQQAQAPVKLVAPVQTPAAPAAHQTVANKDEAEHKAKVPATGCSGATANGTIDSKKRVYGCTVPDCGKVYTKSSHLKSHMRSHTGRCHNHRIGWTILFHRLLSSHHLLFLLCLLGLHP